MSDAEWMTTKEVAAALRVTVKSVHNMLQNGVLQSVERIPGRGCHPSLFLRSDIEAEVARRTRSRSRTHHYSWER